MSDEVLRVRLPQEGELFGYVEQLLGDRRMRVRCSDGKTRICRIPGRLRRVWVREDDIVLVQPWPVEGDKKGDIVWKYRAIEVEWLKSKGYLDDIL